MKASGPSTPQRLSGFLAHPALEKVWYDRVMNPKRDHASRKDPTTPMPSVRNHATRVCLLLICLTAAFLQSCAPTFLYRHADRILLWKIDEYIDLTTDQKGFVRERLKALLARHRTDALPIYERFLIEVKEKSADGLDRQEVDWIFSTYQQLQADLFGRILPDGAVILTSMNEQQVRYLERRFERDNEKAAGRVKEDRESRLTKRAATTVDWLKDWCGTLTKAQQQRVKELSLALPDIPAVWLEYQRYRQQKLLHFLRATHDPHVLSNYLENWLLFPERTTPSDYQGTIDHMKASMKDMVLAVDGLITIQQRAHALSELQHLIDDVHRLAAS